MRQSRGTVFSLPPSPSSPVSCQSPGPQGPRRRGASVPPHQVREQDSERGGSRAEVTQRAGGTRAGQPRSRRTPAGKESRLGRAGPAAHWGTQAWPGRVVTMKRHWAVPVRGTHAVRGRSAKFSREAEPTFARDPAWYTRSWKGRCRTNTEVLAGVVSGWVRGV